MMKILQKILYQLAKAILNKYKPKVIGITGSVGKTSAKEAVFAVLSGKFRIGRGFKNYNNELGVPLTIINAETGGKNIFKWFCVFARALKLIFARDGKLNCGSACKAISDSVGKFDYDSDGKVISERSQDYPEILILEMGADKPGDIKYLTKLAPCDIGILTAIGPTHLEQFKTIKKVAEEKQIIIKHLKANGWAIINYDDELAKAAAEKISARVLSFGFGDGADLRAEEIKLIQEGSAVDTQTEAADAQVLAWPLVLKGVTFKMRYGGALMPVALIGMAGKQAVYAALSGAAVGLAFGMNLLEIAERLKFFQPLPSRMRIISGIKKTVLIDDSYNSSPKAALAALDFFQEIKVAPGAKKIAALGDMLELGSYMEEGHKLIGQKVVEAGADFLVTVGQGGKVIAEAALENGFLKDKIAKFDKSELVGKFLAEKIERGDLLLIKGSQGVRMEKIVVELMSEPIKAKELVCRQDEDWKEK